MRRHGHVTPPGVPVTEPVASPFRIVPAGDRWGVATDDGILVVTGTRRDAAALAAAAARVLDQRAAWKPEIPRERRSFRQDD